MFRDIPKLVFF